MDQGKRSFAVIDARKSAAGKKVKFSEDGRYISRTPVSAAKKAFGRICKDRKMKGKCSMIVTVQETTRGDGGKVFSYKVDRIKLKEPVEITRGGGMFGGGETITIKYTTEAKAVATPRGASQ